MEVQTLKLRRDVVFLQIGAKITYYRTVQGIKQSDLAKKAHISQSSLSKIENGHYDSAISLDLLLDLAEILNIDFTLFLTFNETEQRQWRTEPPDQ